MRILSLLALAAALCTGGEKLGKPLTMDQQTAIADLGARPEQYVGKIVQVKGRVTEVCEKMGCWMNLEDGGKTVRIKVKDGEIMFPKTAPGKLAIAEGKFSRLELTRDQLAAMLKHEAEENGRKFDPASVKSGKTIYQIQGTGAEILE
jgi:hypothetical protein